MELFTLFNSYFFLNFTIFILAFYILCSLCFNVYFNTSKSLDNPALLNASTNFTLYILLGVTMLLIFQIGFNLQDFFGGFLLFYQVFQVIFLSAVICVFIIVRDYYPSRAINKYEYDIILVFTVLGSLNLCFSNDFLLIYLSIELQSLSLYVMATYQRNSEYSTEAGLKYFVLGSVISCILLLGFFLLYLTTGSICLEFINTLLNIDNSLPFTGLLFIITALLFKVGAAPFHFWLCDVYEGSLLSSTLFFSTAPKIIIFSLILNITQQTFFLFADS